MNIPDSVVAENATLREENARLHEEIKGNAIRRNELRAHVAALVKQRDAARKMAHEFGYKCGDYFFAWPLDSPDLAALVERERKRDAVIEAAQAALDKLIPYCEAWSGAKGHYVDDARGLLEDALAALDTLRPLENG